MRAAFAGETLEEMAPAVGVAVCPQCRHRFVPPGAETGRRVTETVTVDPVGGAGILERLRRLGVDVVDDTTTEALINGVRSWDDRREQLRTAVRARLAAAGEPGEYCWAMIVDATDTDLVYATDYGDSRLYQCTYTITGDTVTLGDPVAVERSYSPSPTTSAGDPAAVATETVRVAVEGGARVLEAKGTDAAGHRIFRVRVIAYGDSKNARRYPESVLRAAAPLYEGAKAFDHHRTSEEMSTGTVVGLVGYYTDVAAEAAGVEADLHVLPSRTDVAEALDAALDLAGSGGDAEPLVGISHDVYATFRPIREGATQLQEATGIERVYSADVVAHPAAGGRPTRVVAGGIDDNTSGGTSATSTKEGADVGATTADVLAALAAATPDELAKHGLAKATEAAPVPPAQASAAASIVGEYDRDGWLGKAMIAGKFSESKLPAALLPKFAETLPAKVTEAVVESHLASTLAALSLVERAELAPTVTTQVTKEAVDKKIEGLDKFFDGDYSGYRSIKQAWADVTGYRESYGFLGEDTNKRMLRESAGITSEGHRRSYDSAESAGRASEALLAATWAQVLGDSITRRMIKLYAQPSLQGWRNVVSDRVPVADFRQQRRVRVGGYGLLPVVAEAAPYTPLASPIDEEAVYSVIKRGGTESLTLEMIANDDIGAVRQIPRLLGLAAIITLYRFVFDMIATNPVTSYDTVALFAAGHNNTDNPALLGQSTLDAARAKMRQQAAYGHASNILSIVPKTLVVPSSLETLGYQLTRSAVTVPAGGAGASDVPNIHAGLQLEVVDYLTDANDWYLVADPAMCPTIELGFYQGREEPELFTQADPSVGSMFDTDTVTYKIRHAYSGALLDHRGFYRGANA